MQRTTTGSAPVDEEQDRLRATRRAWADATDGEARLSRERFSPWLVESELVPTNAAADQIFSMLDKSDNGSLSYQEFAACTMPCGRPRVEDSPKAFVENLFQAYNMEMDDFLSRSEMILYFESSLQCSPEEIPGLVDALILRVHSLVSPINNAAMPNASESGVSKETLLRAVAIDPDLIEDFFVAAPSLSVRVCFIAHEARNLVAHALPGGLKVAPNSSCLAVLLNSNGEEVSSKLHSSRARNSVNPQYGGVSRFLTARSKSTSMRLTVEEYVGTDFSTIGSIDVPLSELPLDKVWRRLDASGGSGGAELRFSASLLQKCEENFVEPTYRIHHLRKAHKSDKIGGYSFYEITLSGSGVDDAFGSVEYGWDQNYANARKIFGKGVSAAVIRSIINATHHAAYQNGPFRTEESGHFTGTPIFKENLLMTYVVVGNRLCASATGSTFFRDFLSKHALLSNCAPKVRIAGEMFLDSDGVYHLDNASGTYGPGTEGLLCLADLLHHLFPEMRVVVHEYSTISSYRAKLLAGELPVSIPPALNLHRRIERDFK